MMLELTPDIRRELKSLAHQLAPVVIIGDAGLTEAVQREIGVHLRRHELIKIRVAGDDRAARGGMMTRICEAHEAAAVQHIGKILVVYRPKPVEVAPAQAHPTRKTPARRGSAKRRTKRSYQR
jgi:putative YhbY family RNA-binding protein